MKKKTVTTSNNKVEHSKIDSAKTKKKRRWHLVWHTPKFLKPLVKPARIIGDLIIFPFVLVLPYYFGEIYEDYVMHLDVRGLSKYEIVHENYSITFMYMCAAVTTVILCYLILKRLVYNIRRKD